MVIAGVLLSAAACAAPTVTTDVAAQPVSTPACPETLSPHPATGPAKPMVPGEPGAAVVCHYPAPNPGGPAALAKSVQVTDVKGLVAALNAADTTPPPRGTMCPMNNGTTDVVIFAYAKGDPEYVTVSPTGCATASNGKAKAYRLSDALLSKL
ncbi:hypothetical protein [Kutzneria sp. CA-103260]|uniref:hypothetical protein n=1 Tax=Kutzneria sp. CA-103260 TaxID=2802641 RepID=UPI001BADEDB9|nr:hypothetical protein [Kutzneria sp. CA-103260]QUQ64843.1 hypothetical protein JJ691_25640 [Kutzneria sp. CA-103260]